MKTPKTSSSNRRVVVIALLAATIVTAGMAVVVPASIVKPAYAELDISEKVGEIVSQSVPRLPQEASALISFRLPPALAG
jgi:hypothetical protein